MVPLAMMGVMNYTQLTIDAAKARYLAGHPIKSICDDLQINSRRVIYQWREKYKWDEESRPENVSLTTSKRFNDLIDKDPKTKADLDELRTLADILLILDKREAYQRGDYIGSGRPPGKKNGTGTKRKKKKNDISHLTKAMMDEVREKLLYDHQKVWYEAGQNPLTNLVRFILKSRQIGATFTFAYEAFETAVLTGRNQLFISSTKAQAEVFKSYMNIIAMEHFDVELSGNPVKLSNGAELHFLSPNSYAQSRSGDVYFDEVFWTRSFTKMEELAAPMATLEGCKTTYFSTPSAISHPAYEIWSGERYTKHNKDVKVDISDHASMRLGQMFDDGVWRCVTTIYDAIEMGFDRAKIESLKIKTPDPKLFQNIYGCKFVNDSDSEFSLAEILNCAVDTSIWKFYKPDDSFPVGTKPCTGGYDPAGDGDNASFAIMTTPENIQDKFRLIRKYVWKGVRSPAQCEIIRKECDTFNFEHMAIDNTGPGAFVGDFIEDIFPVVKRHKYSPEHKNRLVQKAKAIFATDRFEYDENDITLPLAFMTVHQTTSKHGVMTYASSHNDEVGHGDEAWAVMEGFLSERLNPTARTISISTVH